MLIVDINTLQSVYALYFLNEVVLYSRCAQNRKYIVRIKRTFGQRVAGIYLLLIANLYSRSERYHIRCGFARLFVHNDYLTLICNLGNANLTRNLRDNGNTLRTSCLKQLLDTGKTLCNIVTCDTAGVEGTHCKLSTRLTDGLCGNNTNRFADVNGCSVRQVVTVALSANANLTAAFNNRTYLYFFDSRVYNRLCGCRVNHLVLRYDKLARFGVNYILCCGSALKTVYKRLDNLVSVTDIRNNNAVSCSAVFFADNDILRYINQAACKITRVSSTQRRIGKTFTRTVRRDKVLKHRKTLTEV